MKKLFLPLAFLTSITSFADVDKRVQMRCYLKSDSGYSKPVLVTILKDSVYVQEMGGCKSNLQCQSVKQQVLASYTGDATDLRDQGIINIENEEESIYLNTKNGRGQLRYIETSRRSDISFAAIGIWKSITEPDQLHRSKDIRYSKTKRDRNITCH